MQASSTIYADDLAPGTVVDVGEHLVTEHEIIEFGRLWDPLPIHVDPEAAARTPQGEVIASGVHMIAVMQRLSVEAFFGRSAIVVGRNILGARFRRPMRPGMTVRGSVRIEAVERRTASAGAVVRTCSTLHDTRTGQLIFELSGESVWAWAPVAHRQEPSFRRGTSS